MSVPTPTTSRETVKELLSKDLAYSDSFGALLSTNFCPESHEEPQLREGLQNAERYVQALSTQLHLVEPLLVKFKILQKRAVAKQFVQDHKTVLCPLRRVPPEIVREICLAAWKGFGPISNKRSNSFFWGFIGVCKAWRTVGLSLRQIWSTYEVDTQAKVNVDELRRALENSQGAPLDIFFNFPVRSAPGVIDVFVSYSAQWKEVVLAISPKELYMLSSKVKDASMLRSLEVDHPRWGRQPPEIPLARYTSGHFGRWLEKAPNLRHVSVPNIPDVLDLHVPWGQLETFDRDGGACSHLWLELVLYRWLSGLTSISPPKRRMFPEPLPGDLKSITFEKCGIIHLECGTSLPFLDCMTTPLLRCVILDIREEATDDEIHGIIAGILALRERSSCTITTLCIRLYRPCSDLILGLLKKLPSVTELFFGRSSTWNEATRSFPIHDLTIPFEGANDLLPPQPILLPALAKLRLTFLTKEDDERFPLGSDILHLLQSRQEHGLKHFGMRGISTGEARSYGFSKQVLNEFLLLEERGFHIYFGDAECLCSVLQGVGNVSSSSSYLC